MKPSITVLTLGADDLDRALQFYRDGLGLTTDGIVGKEIGCFLDPDQHLWEVAWNPQLLPSE